MLIFNQTGLLVPDNGIISDLSELRDEFVVNIPSIRRSDIFTKFLKYNEDLKNVCGLTELKQWIDGSFVTKKVNPGDIDLVTFIDSEKLQEIGSIIDRFKFPNSESNYGVDAYIVEVYREDDREYSKTLSDTAYWHDRFTKTRRNRSGNRLKKGFLQIKS